MKLSGISIADASRGVLDHIHDPKICYEYGFRDLSDDLCTGPGHFVLLGAKTGCGKTLLGLQVAHCMAETGIKTHYLSL